VTRSFTSTTVAVLGFGHQGEAHALNLRDSGVQVTVGARAGHSGEARARAAKLRVLPLADAAREASVVAVMLPDEVLPRIWPEISRGIAANASLVFAHGFNLLYEDLAFPQQGNVVLVSPTGPGRVLRAAYEKGAKLPAYLAVDRGPEPQGWELADAYAAAIGCAPTWRTTVREETEVDLFGEQVVLCGGMNALVTAAFDTLVAKGYAPEMAYLECVHQLKYLADLLHERGVAGMRRGISGTARFGDVTRGPRVIGPATREAMREVLEEIRSGAFAREWKAEEASGQPQVAKAMVEADAHPIERARRRALGAGEATDAGG